MKYKEMPPAEDVRRGFSYQPTDTLRPLVIEAPGSNRVRRGDRAGSLFRTGYVWVGVNGSRYALHRIVYLWHHGLVDPGMVIDHIDGNPLNNLIENLQQVTASHNSQKADFSTRVSNPSSVYRGISLHRASGLWHARIYSGGEMHSLKYHKTEIGAAKAYDAKVNELGTAHTLNFPDF